MSGSVAKADSSKSASEISAAEAMKLTNAAETQSAPATQSPAVAPPPIEPPAIASPTPETAPNAAAKVQGNTTWKWVLGIVVGGIMGFFLARIITAKPKEMPVALEDEEARIRRRNHKRGHGSTPASREEQQLSRSLDSEFMRGPMRHTMNQVPEQAPDNTPPPPPVPPTPAAKPAANKPKNPKPARPMPDTAPNPASINELIDASAAAPVEPAGPVQFYAPAPDVPSIEHRKLSPNPLAQMPLLVKLTHPEATKAEFQFSPQADQSRIIGNGVRELKEFFAFELPPTEQFTTIKNLTPGKLEKRDDTWHVVQKATIELS